MTKENSEKLTERFKMFQSSIDDRRKRDIFPFECGDGWFQLIWNLCEELEKVEKVFLESIPIKEKTKSLLKDKREYEIMVLQVKEKFGTMRFYINNGTEEMYELINKAEEKSGEICEVCGQPGKIRKKTWIYCSCDQHII